RGLHEGDGRSDRGARQGEAPSRAGRARPGPALRRRDRREPPRELEGVRLHQLEEPRGGWLRFCDLETGRQSDVDARGSAAADRGTSDPGSTLRLPVSERQTFSCPARLERRGQDRVRVSRSRANQRARGDGITKGMVSLQVRNPWKGG